MQKFIDGHGGEHAMARQAFTRVARKCSSKKAAICITISEQNFAPNVYDFTVKRAHVSRDARGIELELGMFGATFQRYDIIGGSVMEGRMT